MLCELLWKISWKWLIYRLVWNDYVPIFIAFSSLVTKNVRLGRKSLYRRPSVVAQCFVYRGRRSPKLAYLNWWKFTKEIPWTRATWCHLETAAVLDSLAKSLKRVRIARNAKRVRAKERQIVKALQKLLDINLLLRRPLFDESSEQGIFWERHHLIKPSSLAT